MGRHYSFRLGSFYRTDDRTGFPQRAENTRRQWNNLIVDESVWEPRQPQDLVKGVKDNQSVSQPRPLAPATFVGPVWTTTTDYAPVGTAILPIQSNAGFQTGDTVAIMVGAGDVFITTLLFSGGGPPPLQNEDGSLILNEDGQPILAEGPLGAILLLAAPLPEAAENGTQVWNYKYEQPVPIYP